jgi:predicted RNA-binding Zn-ribbon protein involved in translation (DUF1610 family)
MAIIFKDGLCGNETVEFELVTCANCKVGFMLTSKHVELLRKSHNTFYCPNGHHLSYGKTTCEVDKEKLEKDLANQKHWVERLSENNTELMAERWQLKKQVLEMRKTACPTCGKKVIDIKKHIKKYHSK